MKLVKTKQSVHKTKSIKPKLITIQDLARMYPFCSEGAWRMRLSKNYLGIKKCVRKYGYRTYIDVKEFNKWIKDID